MLGKALAVLEKAKLKAADPDPLQNPLILIPTFENPTYVQMMTRALEHFHLTNWLLLDGGSTYPDMCELLSRHRESGQVIDLPMNPGPMFFAREPSFYEELPRFFCVTDPDMSFNPNMPSNFLYQMALLGNELEIGKIGLALSIVDNPKLTHERVVLGGRAFSIRSWEERFWTEHVPNSMGLEAYLADVDTTFALYDKQYFSPENFFKAIRVAGHFTATHLPWLEDDPRPHDEHKHYVARQKTGVYRPMGDLSKDLARQLDDIHSSFSWRITRPMRSFGSFLSRFR